MTQPDTPSIPRPPRPNDPVELKLATSAALLVAALAIPTIAISWLVAGTDGALSAAIGAAVVIGMFLMTGGLLSWAAKISPTAMFGAALGGYVLRLAIYAGLIVVLRPVDFIHGPTLAISAAILLVVALVWEVRLVTRNPATLWIDPQAPRPRSSTVVESPPFAAIGAATPTGPTSHDSPVERTRP